MRTITQKMFKGPLDNWSLNCSECTATYHPTELAAARAHQNFKPGHTIVVSHAIEGGIAPLNMF